MPILSDEACIEIRQRFMDLSSNTIEPSIIEDWAKEYRCSTTTIENIIHDRSYRRPECYPSGALRDAAIKRGVEWKEQQRLSRNAKSRERYSTRKYRDQVLERDGYRCVYCDADLRTITAHIDHRTPLVDGGSQDIDNLQATCSKCNRRKKSFSPSKFVAGEDGIAEYLWRRHLVDLIVEIASGIECWNEWDKWARDTFEKPFYRLCWAPDDERMKTLYEDHVTIFKSALDGDIERTRELVIKHVTEDNEMIASQRERDHWIEHAYCGDGDKWHDGECKDN